MSRARYIFDSLCVFREIFSGIFEQFSSFCFSRIVDPSRVKVAPVEHPRGSLSVVDDADADGLLEQICELLVCDLNDIPTRYPLFPKCDTVDR